LDVGAEVTKTAMPGGGEGVAANAYGEASVMEVVDVGSGMVSRGLELLYLAITLRVARSFIDKSKGSNTIEQELSVVKQQTKRRL
jgi:hypothetical protein